MARTGTALPVVERVLDHVSGSFAGIERRHAFERDERIALHFWSAFAVGLNARGGRVPRAQMPSAAASPMGQVGRSRVSWTGSDTTNASPPPNTRRPPSNEILERQGIVSRTLGGWMVDPDLGFPEPLTMDVRHCFDLGETGFGVVRKDLQFQPGEASCWKRVLSPLKQSGIARSLASSDLGQRRS